MQYPLDVRFKIFALASQISVRDATGQPLMFVKQKMFKLKEHVVVYSDAEHQQPIFEIKADRMIDFSANYSFTSSDGVPWGAVRRQGRKSLWSAHYDVIQDGRVDMTIREEKPWKRLVESLLGEIPIVGIAAVIMINPTYLVTRPNGELLWRVLKKRTFLEGRFVIEKIADMPEDDELRGLLALIMMILLERRRG